jgi:FAD:protein FMN transferase
LRTRRVGLGLVLAVLGPGLALAAPRRGPLQRHESHRLSMACVYTIVAYGPDPAALAAATERALDEVDRIDRLMSHYRPESPLSRLNREAASGPVAVGPELFAFLAECLRYSRETEGAFDVTVGALMKTWGFFGGEGRLPSDGEIAAALDRVGYRHLRLEPERHTVGFDRVGVELDLGGIAKGYAVDRAVGVLEEAGITAALISAGGSTLYALGAPPGGKGWKIALQDPLRPARIVRRVLLRDRALSVAGSRGKFFEAGGASYSHIMDPRTGRPAKGVLGVAVVTDTGTRGDALDDALFVLGPARSGAYLERLPPTEAFFFLARGRGTRLVHRVN